MFLRRLWIPVLSLAAFIALCIFAFWRLEGLGWLDGLFWIFHQNAIHYDKVQDATKAFSIFVYFGVMAFQIWFAQRVLSVIFRKEGREAWRLMVNDAHIDKIRDHFIVCGYGQVGRTVVEQLERMKIPFVLIERDEEIYRQLLEDGVPVVHGDANRKAALQAAGIEQGAGHLRPDRQRLGQPVHHGDREGAEPEAADHHPGGEGAVRPGHEELRRGRGDHPRVRGRPDGREDDREILERVGWTTGSAPTGAG